MLKKLFLSVFLTFAFLSYQAHADEGMWLLSLLQKLNYDDMRSEGLQLSADQIYSINQSSLKDAIVSLGGFCTGEIISSEGLLLTNHHCGFESVQSHSTVENNLLKNGFFAANHQEELPTPGLYAKFLVRMEDVTSDVLAGITDEMNESQREALIGKNMDKLQIRSVENTHYDAEIKSFFGGNEFYLFVYETFTDVRLVGAPPESIGKFGGDTDNWMWPRQTGDFSLFRVYTDPKGNPANYSANNIPLRPRYHLPISLSGVREGDFAMVMGFPGSTERYLTSYGVKLALDISNPTRVNIRDRRLEIMKNDMDADEDIRIKYASKYAQVSNYWKYFIGQSEGLKRLDVLSEKEKIEQEFMAWAQQDAAWKQKYGQVLREFEQTYNQIRNYETPYIYFVEGVFGTEILPFAYEFMAFQNRLKDTPDKLDGIKTDFTEKAEQFFEDYNAATDQKVFAALMEMFYRNVPEIYHPDILTKAVKKYNMNFSQWAKQVFEKSMFADKEKTLAFIEDPSEKALEKDPAFKTVSSFLQSYFQKIAPTLKQAYESLSKDERLYIAGLREMHPDKKYYPDANSTLRLTYGKVLSYEPRDGVEYEYQTTLKGVIEKMDPDNPEFQVPEKLVALYEKEDYGDYGVNGMLPVCFITNNDITGGNSGSPVINAKGELIGTAFDGNWEAMSGDIAFEPNLQRCISVDIRYTLFLIDKFAGARHLVDEMTLISEAEEVTK